MEPERPDRRQALPNGSADMFPEHRAQLGSGKDGCVGQLGLVQEVCPASGRRTVQNLLSVPELTDFTLIYVSTTVSVCFLLFSSLE